MGDNGGAALSSLVPAAVCQTGKFVQEWLGTISSCSLHICSFERVCAKRLSSPLQVLLADAGAAG